MNKTSNTQVPYAIGGLPPRTRFKLLLWNRAGGGVSSGPDDHHQRQRRGAYLTTLLHSVFALTTKALPVDLD